MKLAQILIQAGVKPSDLLYDCNFIRQFNYDSREFYFYSKHVGDGYTAYRSNLALAEDWQTPLSRADFIAAYEEHLMPKAAQPTDTEMLDWLISNKTMEI